MRQHFLDTPNVKRVFNINLTLQNYEKKADLFFFRRRKIEENDVNQDNDGYLFVVR